MLKSEKGSVTLIVVATILFIFAVLATNLVYVSAKRKSQLEETIILQGTYGSDMSEAYSEQIDKIQAETTKIFDNTANVQEYTVTVPGTYLLEVYGAQGGNVTTYTGANGSYSKGTIELKKGDILYVHIGKKGTDNTTSASSGGTTYISKKTGSDSSTESTLISANGGGGATDKANGTTSSSNTNTGSLTEFETKTNERSGDGFAKISFCD